MSDTLYQSLSMRCMQAILDRIQSLGLPGIDELSFYIRKFPWNIQVTHPACLLYPVNERVAGGTNASDDVGIGIGITFTQPSNRDLSQNMDRLLFWRENTLAALHNSRLEGICEVYLVTVETANTVFDPFSFAAQYDATQLIARCMTRRLRIPQ